MLNCPKAEEGRGRGGLEKEGEDEKHAVNSAFSFSFCSGSQQVE